MNAAETLCDCSAIFFAIKKEAKNVGWIYLNCTSSEVNIFFMKAGSI